MSDASTAAPPRAPNPILAVLGRALESALDRVLDLDQETRSELRSLDGRAVTVEFRNTPLAMRIAVNGDRLAIGPAFEGTSALRVAATPGALLSLALSRGREGAITPGTVDIAGDAELARRLERI
ncbi:MAG: SCP2 sterol-binding domain-containing protein, partial [Rhodanobacteraceae bacterium]